MDPKQHYSPVDASVSITQLNDLDKLKAYMFLRHTALNTPILRDKIIQSSHKKANGKAFEQLFKSDPATRTGLINNLSKLSSNTLENSFNTILSNSPERNMAKWSASGIERQTATYKQLYLKQLIKDPASAIISTLAEKTIEIKAYQEAFQDNSTAKIKSIDQDNKMTRIISNLTTNIQNVYGASLDDVKKMSTKVFSNKSDLDNAKVPTSKAKRSSDMTK